MRWRTDDVLGRAEGRHLLERKGTLSDLAPAFLWLAQTICISQESFGRFFYPSQPVLTAACTLTSEANKPTRELHDLHYGWHMAPLCRGQMGR